MIKLICGNATDALSKIKSNSIQCVITSPPYYNLRDYGIKEQIGLEETPDQYISSLRIIFDDIKRVLKEDGTLWLNIGDCYCGSNGPGSSLNRINPDFPIKRKTKIIKEYNRSRSDGYKPKDLIGIPWMLAFALRDSGWYLRSDIIWHKPNVMPNSVRDRPNTDHEYLFLMAKSKKYYYNADAVRVPYDKPMNRWGGEKLVPNGKSTWDNATKQHTYRDRKMRPNSNGRNLRTVWTINTRPYKGAHFAVFPEALVEPCILAGSKKGDIILDPFCGSGMVGAVAKRLGRSFIGIDLNPEYIKLSEERINVR